jgi:PAS domain S-box-containing protein
MLQWALVGMLLAIAVAQFGMSVWLFRNSKGREVLLLISLLLCAMISVLGTAVQVSVQSLEAKVALMAAWTPFFWGCVPLFVALTLSLAGYPHWLTRRTAAVGGAFWVLCTVFALTNPVFELLHVNYHLTTEPFPALSYDRTPLYQAISSITLGSMLFALAVLVPTLINSNRWRRRESIFLLSMNAPVFLVGLVLLTNTHLEFHPLILVSGLLALVYGGVFIRQQHLAGETLARQTAFSHVNEGIIVLDTDGRISDYNDTAEHIFPELADAIGHHIATVEPSLWNASETTPAPEEAPGELNRDKNGEQQIYSVTSSPITLSDQIYGHVLGFHDVTEIRDREKELKQQNERLDSFAGTLSHDLRNPLNVAQLQLDLVKQEYDSDHLTAVEKAHERMECLIDDVLTLVRTDTELDESDELVLADIARKAWSHTETTDCELVLNFSREATVQADRQQLLQIFENLYRNAVEHNTPPLTVRTGKLDAPRSNGDTSGFYIEDNGDGIPPEEQDDVFSHGYTTDSNGTGLGLAIVQKNVQAHDWKITVTTGDEGGARFEIHIK